MRLAVAGGVGTITLDSQANRNALSAAVLDGLVAAIKSAEADAAVRVVILAAAGRTWCAGADLGEAVGDGMEQGARRVVAVQRAILASAKPYVARVHAAVRAGGLGLVGACDLVICEESVTFALTEVRLGLAPLAISVSVLPRLTSRGAARLLLTGETFDAHAAVGHGVVTAAVPAADLDAEVQRVVADLLKGSSQGLRETKRLVNESILVELDRLGDDRATRSATLFASVEAREAMAALLNRPKQ